MLLSISLQSKRPQNVIDMCNNISETVSDPNQVEILFGIDDHDNDTEEALIESQKKHDFKIKYLKNKYEGFLQLYKYLDRMHNQICDPNAYFVQHSNDEVRFVTKNWDEILKKYVGFFNDDIFRLRCSKHKMINYFDILNQSLNSPDNTPIHTKKWIDITGWCNFHSADLYQQMVSLYLARGNPEFHPDTMFNRDIPIFDIDFTGLEASQGNTEEEDLAHHYVCEEAWSNATSIESQEVIQYKANLLRAQIISDKYEDITYIESSEKQSIDLYRGDEIFAEFFFYYISKNGKYKMTPPYFDIVRVCFANPIISFIIYPVLKTLLYLARPFLKKDLERYLSKFIKKSNIKKIIYKSIGFNQKYYKHSFCKKYQD